MQRPKQSGHPVTNRQSLLNQMNSSAVTVNREDRLQQRHLPRPRGGVQYSPPTAATTIMNPEDVCYDYHRTDAWLEPHPYGPSNPYHQMPHAYRVSAQQTHHPQINLSRDFTDLSQMGKYESPPELARGSGSYLRDPGHVVSADQWTQADDMVDPHPSGYSLPIDPASLWQSYYPATYAGVSRQLGSTAAQLTPSTGYQTFYNQHLTSSISDTDSLIPHSLSGHLHEAGSRRSSTDESRTSTIQSSGYQIAAHSIPFPVLRPSQADFSVLHVSPPDPTNRLHVLSDTPGNAGSTHMRSYRHGMPTQDDAIHYAASSAAPLRTGSSSDMVQSSLQHILIDDSSASETSSQRYPLTNDAKPKVTPSTSIGKTRTREKYRTVYTEQQKVELEKEYVKGTFISVQRKADIAKEVGLSERQVKIWFQNRRAKDRKTRRKTEDNCVSTSHGLTSAITQVHSSVHSSDAESLPDTMSANEYGGQRIYDFHQRIQQQ